MNKADVITSLILLFFGIGFTYESTKLSYMHILAPGPGFLPFWIGVLFSLLGLSLLISSILSRGMDKTNWPNRQMALKLLSVVMALFLYILLMDFVGYAISTVVFCTSMIKILFKRCRWIDALIIANIISITLTGVFQVWFRVPLPKMVFEFLTISTVLKILAGVSVLLCLYSWVSKARETSLHR